MNTASTTLPERATAQRLAGPDVVRAVALIGVVVMNYHGYLILRSFDDFRWRQPDAVISHVHSGIPRTCCDLFCAIGMAVQTRLADKDTWPTTEFI